MALLCRRFTDPADDTSEAFEAFDYLVDHIVAGGLDIPMTLWQISLAEAQLTECNELGYAASQSNNPLIAELAFRRAADAGLSEAMNNLAVLLHQRGELDEAEIWWRRAGEAGVSLAMFNVGVLLHQRGELDEAEIWWRRAGEAGVSEAMYQLGGCSRSKVSWPRRRPGTSGCRDWRRQSDVEPRVAVRGAR